MKYCKNCHLNIENPRECCPLCQTPLINGDGKETESFPESPVSYEKHAFLIRLLFFFSLVAIIICAIVNIVHFNKNWWSVIVIASIAYFWLIIYNLLQTRARLSSIAKSAALISILLFLIDGAYGFTHWSFNYAIPALFIAAIASVVIISVIRELRFADFLIYLIMTAVFALLPLIFLLCGLAQVIWPSLVCILCGLCSFIAVAVFADQTVKSELKRRFHL